MGDAVGEGKWVGEGSAMAQMGVADKVAVMVAEMAVAAKALEHQEGWPALVVVSLEVVGQVGNMAMAA